MKGPRLKRCCFTAGLTVCEVMICAKLNIFSVYGAPLTRSAALMLADAAPGIGNVSASDVTASAVTPLAAESCPGYTTSGYKACPTGQQVHPWQPNRLEVSHAAVDLQLPSYDWCRT